MGYKCHSFYVPAVPQRRPADNEAMFVPVPGAGAVTASGPAD